MNSTIHCKKLGYEVLKDATDVIKTKVHIFGHIHEAYGQKQTEDTIFINASVLDVRYRLVNAPLVIEM